MKFKLITPNNDEWKAVIEYTDSCSWGAGKCLANMMRRNEFSEWERVIIAVDSCRIAGFCTVTKTDCIPFIPYTPYIGFLFVDEKYRGYRLSHQFINFAVEYLKNTGFDKVYLISDHIGFYEKYGFKVIEKCIAPWGEEEKIYVRIF